MNKNKKIQAIVYRINNNQIEYLALKRTKEKGSIWQPVTGNVNSNEEVKNCCIREIKEEIGVKNIIKIHENINSFKYFSEIKNKELEEFVFGIEINPNDKITLQQEPYIEHDDYIWVSYDGAFELFEFISQKESLNILHKKLLKN